MIDLCAVDSNRMLWVCMHNGNHWSGWKHTEQIVNPRHGSTSSAAGFLDVVSIYNNRILPIRSTNGGPFLGSPSFDQPPNFGKIFGVYASAWDHELVQSILIADDGKVAVSSLTANASPTWYVGEKGQSKIGDACAAVSWGGYRIDLFATDQNGNVYRRVYQ